MYVLIAGPANLPSVPGWRAHRQGGRLHARTYLWQTHALLRVAAGQKVWQALIQITWPLFPLLREANVFFLWYFVCFV